ncbi:LURP-one-related domain-containing protein [Ditylenchus destructor]|uniref:LURP-one-related domain-containing protein n=1 Tax=Ditylenchus destructor TaxID=166010 RepID=A0AAD4MWP3_9BILA|nr:LURP-one-related domain-containing protein [Ditylenchus destructor]
MESDEVPLVTEPKQSYPPGKVFDFATTWCLKQVVFWSDMVIKDAWGNEVFKAESKWSFARQLDFMDLRNGEKVAHIKQQLMSALPKFDIVVDGNHFASVKMEWALKPKFTITPGKAERYSVNSLGIDGPITIQGDSSWLTRNYEFRCGDRIIAKVHRPFLVATDTYNVDIEPGMDVIFILACCIVIDKSTTNT